MTEGSRQRSEKWAEAHGIAGLAKGADGEYVADALRLVYAAREDAERDTRERCAHIAEQLKEAGNTKFNEGWNKACDSVADAIRKGE